jgi:hypothetical protein
MKESLLIADASFDKQRTNEQGTEEKPKSWLNVMFFSLSEMKIEFECQKGCFNWYIQ